MGISIGPKPIITDNLIFYADAANPESMPRGGSTWTDIIGGVEISLQGDTPWWISKHGGCIDFDGTNDYGTFTHPVLGTESFTIELWVDPSDNYYNYITFMCTTRGSSGYSVGSDGGNDSLYYDQGPQGANRHLEANEGSPLSGMHLHTFTRDSDNSGAMVLYVDAVQLDTGTSTINLTDTSGHLAQLNSGAEDMNGRIACIRMYKGLALTQEQVTQNFNAQKDRFGL